MSLYLFHTHNYLGQNCTVYVIDSGVYEIMLLFRDEASNNTKLRVVSIFVNPSSKYLASHNHGTAVAWIIAGSPLTFKLGSNRSIETIGIAPNATIISLCIQKDANDTFSVYQTQQYIDRIWQTQKTTPVSNSYGTYEPNSYEITNKITKDIYKNQNGLFVYSSGNSGREDFLTTDQSSSPNAICVGGIQDNNIIYETEPENCTGLYKISTHKAEYIAELLNFSSNSTSTIVNTRISDFIVLDRFTGNQQIQSNASVILAFGDVEIPSDYQNRTHFIFQIISKHWTPLSFPFNSIRITPYLDFFERLIPSKVTSWGPSRNCITKPDFSMLSDNLYLPYFNHLKNSAVTMGIRHTGSSFSGPQVVGFMVNYINFLQDKAKIDNPTPTLVAAACLASTNQSDIYYRAIRNMIGNGPIRFELVCDRNFSFAENITITGPAMSATIECPPNTILRIGMNFQATHMKDGYNPLPYSLSLCITHGKDVVFSNAFEGDHTTAFHTAEMKTGKGGTFKITIFSTDPNLQNIARLSVFASGTTETREITFTEESQCLPGCPSRRCNRGICECDDNHRGFRCRQPIAEPPSEFWVDGAEHQFFRIRNDWIYFEEIGARYIENYFTPVYSSCTNSPNIASYEFEDELSMKTNFALNLTNKCNGTLFIAIHNPNSIAKLYKSETEKRRSRPFDL